MKITNTLLNALTKTSSDEINDSSIVINKSDNFFHNSFNKLFHRKDITVVIEENSEIEEITEIEFLDSIMSEDDFLDLLPANSYFH